MNKIYPVLCLFVVLLSCQEHAGNNSDNSAMPWQHLPGNFVLKDQKKIKIPGQPVAYNASIIRFNNELLLAYRWDEHEKARHIGLVTLDDNLDLKGPPTVINDKNPSRRLRLPEDPRLFIFQQKLWVMFNDTTDRHRQLYIAKVEKNSEGKFYLNDTVRLLYDSGMTQKNWIPFDDNGRLRVIYWMDPLTVLDVDTETGICRQAVDGVSHRMYPWNQYPWSGRGHIRGGTAAFYDEDFDAFLTFFHSSATVSGTKYYYMGVATFRTEAPWNFTRMSPDHLAYKGMYSDSVNPSKIVFPCGFIKSGDHYFVSYGLADGEIEIARITLEDVKKSLVNL